jgi:hypothetical protein
MKITNMNKCNITDWAPAKDVENWTPVVNRVLKNGVKHLKFPAGTYHFYREGGDCEYCFFSNNDEGLKHIVFNVVKFEGIIIDGENADFIFHDRVVPFRFKKCSDITIKGIAVDFASPTVIPAEVELLTSDCAALRFRPEQFYRIIKGNICFIDDEFKFINHRIHWTTVDPVRIEQKAGSKSGSCSIAARELEPGLIEFNDFTNLPFLTDTLLLKPEPRLTPGIVFDECRKVLLEDVSLYHAGGMGILAQNSFDLTLNRVKISIRVGSKRLFSVSDDAAHFANCGGKINIIDSIFMNQLDDGVNIHCFYRDHINVNGNHLLRAGHYQQLGVNFVKPGERLMADGKIFIPNRVWDDKQYAWIQLDTPLKLPDNAPVINLERQPEVKIQNSLFSSNAPRGILATTSGRIRIENNKFHTPGCAIKFDGDAKFWYEGGPVADAVICDNSFENCLYNSSGRNAVIDIYPNIDTPSGEFYHRNISVENNDFSDSHHKAVYAKNSDNITVCDNRWHLDNTYNIPAGEGIILEKCGRSIVKNNGF